MTEAKRNQKILDILKKHTDSLDTPEKAREWLISTGIYNKDGSLHKDYGG